MKTFMGIALLSMSLIVPRSAYSDDLSPKEIADLIMGIVKPIIENGNNNNNNQNNNNWNNNNNNNNWNNNNNNRPMLGFNCKTYGNNTGVMITAVRRNGTAEQIGLRPGMIIIKVNNNPVGSPGQFTNELVNAQRWARQSGFDEEVLLHVVNQNQTAVNTTRFFVDSSGNTYGTTLRLQNGNNNGTAANRMDNNFDNLQQGGPLQ